MHLRNGETGAGPLANPQAFWRLPGPPTTREALTCAGVARDSAVTLRDPRSQRVSPASAVTSAVAGGTIGDVADSGALRTERYKRHKMGDHSICRRECGKPRLVLAGETPNVGDFDPVAEMRRLAGQLCEAYS